jgi:hypothetical protein
MKYLLHVVVAAVAVVASAWMISKAIYDSANATRALARATLCTTQWAFMSTEDRTECEVLFYLLRARMARD